MSPQDVAKLLSAVAWPITVLGLVLLFRTPIRSFLDKLANSLRVKALKFTFLGVESELPLDEVEEELDEMLQEIVDTMNEVTPEEKNLLLDIRAAAGEDTVHGLRPDFKRSKPGGENKVHEDLRSLRGKRLIRPRPDPKTGKEGPWQDDKRPVVTRFGELALSLYAKVQKQQNPPPGS